jgi:hypothetical protein
MAGPISRLRSFIRGYFTRECFAADDKPLAIAQDTTPKAKSRKRTRSVAPSERFVWAMALLIIALVGLIVLEALYICVTKSVSAEAISALSGSVATAFLVGKQK